MEIHEIYLENYEITLCGKIYHKNKKKQISTQQATRGYMTATLHNTTLKKTFYVHRLVALTHIPLIQGKNLVNHKDGNKLNNKVNNLEWMTPRENSIHSIKTLRKEVGENHSRARVPNELVLGIRMGNITSEMFPDISQKYQVGIQHLKNILAGRKRIS